jgi:elongation factor Ts
MEIPAKLVKELRELTNAGFSDCRAALVEASGDIQKAVDVLRKKGQAAAAKKATREAIAAVDPRYVRREDVTPEMLEKEREIYAAQARATGKPEPVIQKIVQGKMEKFYEESCLYEQHFIKDETVTIGEKITQAIAKLGENITIRRFARFKVGEIPNQLAGAPAPAAVPQS